MSESLVTFITQTWGSRRICGCVTSAGLISKSGLSVWPTAGEQINSIILRKFISVTLEQSLISYFHESQPYTFSSLPECLIGFPDGRWHSPSCIESLCPAGSSWALCFPQPHLGHPSDPNPARLTVINNGNISRSSRGIPVLSGSRGDVTQQY